MSERLIEREAVRRDEGAGDDAQNDTSVQWIMLKQDRDEITHNYSEEQFILLFALSPPVSIQKKKSISQHRLMTNDISKLRYVSIYTKKQNYESKYESLPPVRQMNHVTNC